MIDCMVAGRVCMRYPPFATSNAAADDVDCRYTGIEDCRAKLLQSTLLSISGPPCHLLYKHTRYDQNKSWVYHKSQAFHRSIHPIPPI